MLTNWPEYLKYPSNLDGTLRFIFVISFVILIVANSSVFEEPYAVKLAELHTQPWWRILMAMSIIFAAIWCPRVGIIVAFLVFLYLSDIEMLTKPFIKLTL